MDKKNVKLIEIGPRDGFQSVKEEIPLKTKLEIIDATLAAGFKKMQCTSFVSPKAIPQMSDAAQVVEHCLSNYPDREFFALAPNARGVKSAVEAGLKEVAFVVSLSESHNKNNVNRTHEQSFAELQQILLDYPELIIEIDVATAFGCPFEGRKSAEQVIEFVGKLKEIGLSRFNICDTIGVASPSKVKETFTQLIKTFPDDLFSVHIHDTRNMGMINSLIALECGASAVQTTLGGLGGCPFAPGATGNTATEDLNYMLMEEGWVTNIDQAKLLVASKLQHSKVNGNYSGHQIMITACHQDFIPK